MPKTVDPQAKRAELVAASWDVIAREGLKGATLRRVAAEAGCTTGALTHYFADRNALLVAALRAAHFQAGERMLAAARTAEPGLATLRAVLLESLPLDAVRLREWRVWLAFWAAAPTDPALAAENERRYAEWRRVLRELLEPLAGDGAAAERDHLIALVDGLGLQIARTGASGGAFEAAAEACRATLERHLAGLEAS